MLGSLSALLTPSGVAAAPGTTSGPALDAGPAAGFAVLLQAATDVDILDTSGLPQRTQGDHDAADEPVTDPALGVPPSADAAQQLFAMIGIVPAVQPGPTDGSAPATAAVVDDGEPGEPEVSTTASAHAGGALHATPGLGIVAPTSALRAAPRPVEPDPAPEGNTATRTRRDDAVRKPVAGEMRPQAKPAAADQPGAHDPQAAPESPGAGIVPASTQVAPPLDPPAALAVAATAPAAVPVTRAPADALPPALQHGTREATVQPTVGSESFAPALGLHVSTLASDGVQHARLHLNPAELGPITVRIALDGSGARVDFQADAAFTRSAIEASLPALASAMHEAGLTLTGGGVFQQPQDRPADGQPRSSPQFARAQDAQVLDLPEDAAGAMRPIPLRRGLVDLVA